MRAAPRRRLPEAAAVVRVSAATTREELHRLREAWEEALQEAGEPSPFLSFDWVATWWDHFGDGRKLLALVAEDERGVVGLAPLVISRYRFRGLPLRVLEFAGAPLRGRCLAGCLDIVAPRRQAEGLAALAAALLAEARRWDVLSLRNVPVESEQVPRLAEVAARRLALVCARRQPVACLRAEGWEEYLASRRPSFRRELRRHADEAREAGLGPLRQITDPEQVAAVLPELHRLHAASQRPVERGESPRPGDLADGFLASLLPRLCSRGQAALSTLSAEDRMVAYQLALRTPGTLWLYSTAYDRDYAQASPGANVIAAAIEHALRSHVPRVDLGPGLQEYKARWATECAYRGHWLGFHRGLRSRAFALAARLAQTRRRTSAEVGP